MERKFNFNPASIITPNNDEPKKTTRRCFIKRTAAFTGLALSPLELASKALAADQQMEYLINNLSVADIATAGIGSSACSAISRADLNKDGNVNSADLRIMAREWLSPHSSAISNIDTSETWILGSAGSVVAVDNKDFAELAKYWQKSTCSASSTIY